MNKLGNLRSWISAVVLGQALLLQGCATTDQLYAEYECNSCPESVHLIPWEPAIYFGFDSSVLLPEEQARLDNNYLLLKENPGFFLVVRGFTDSFGRKSYNDRLAKRRVGSALNYFTALGIAETRIIKAPLGESGALSPRNNSAIARAINRRVEMMMVDATGQPVRMRVHATESVTTELKVGDEGNRVLREFDEVGGTGLSFEDDEPAELVDNAAREEKSRRAIDDVEPENRPGAWWEPAIYFPADSNSLDSQERERLKNLEAMLDLNPDITLAVRGYFDRFGNRDRNIGVATERVREVRRFLRKAGVPSDQLFVAPLAESASDPSKQQSQHDQTASSRVEFLPVDIDGRPVRLFVSEVQQVDRGTPQPETQ